MAEKRRMGIQAPEDERQARRRQRDVTQQGGDTSDRDADIRAVEDMLGIISGGGLSLSERVMCIAAEHSERAVYYWDFSRDIAVALNSATALAAGLPTVMYDPLERLLELSGDFADSAAALRGILGGVRTGVTEAEMKLHLRDATPTGRWYDMRCTRIATGGRRRDGAVVSFLEVTKRHQQETAYARYLQNIGSTGNGTRMYLEVNLTADLVERHGGKADLPIQGVDTTAYSQMLRRLAGRCFSGERLQAVLREYSREELIRKFEQDGAELLDDWMTTEGDCPRWLRVSVQMVSDPYSGHVKALGIISDVSEEKNRLLRAQRQAETDRMTGLYNRVTAEELICAKLAADEHGGMLLIMDIDDFKALNDSLGHAQGDRALCAVAEELKNQFRSTDIIGRLGGDEFVVFLPGVTSEQSVCAPLSALMARMSDVAVGEHGEHSVHCSIGGSEVAGSGGSFYEMYRQADAALYHVKRCGKNGFAFFSPDMLRESTGS